MNNHGKTAEIAGLDLATCELKDIDKALRNLIDEEKNDWFKYYRLIDTVEERELYKPKFNSLTAWLRSFCASSSLSEQRAWQIKRAGAVYDGYIERHQDESPPELSELKIAPQVLQNIDKAACCRYTGYDYDEDNRNRYMDSQIEKAIKGELTRDGSQELYVNERRKAKQAKELEEKGRSDRREQVIRNTETADAIKKALEDWRWIGEKKEVGTNHKQKASTRNYYDLLTEVDISTPGQAQSYITADAVVMENLTSATGYTVNIHAIEIKADSYDYMRDNKYIDYRTYSDYLWLVTPESVLLELDPHDVPKEVGILAFAPDGITGGRIVEEERSFQKVDIAPDEFGNDQVVIARELTEEDAPPLYQVRKAEFNGDTKQTDQLLRHWVVRKR